MFSINLSRLQRYYCFEFWKISLMMLKSLMIKKCYHSLVRSQIYFCSQSMSDGVVAWKIKSAKIRENAFDLFNDSVRAVTPQTMVFNNLKVRGDVLIVNEQSYVLNNNVHVVAFGKAVIGMVKTAEDILGNHIVDGVASVPYGIQGILKSLGKWDFLPSVTSKVQIIEGSRNNIPDDHALEASRLITELIRNCDKDDIVLVLISGGGSALLPSPIPPITLKDLSILTQILSKKGVTIHQLNLIRKHIELLKGGGLAELAYPAKVISLILSDVVDNDINFIASGPTAPDYSTPHLCMDLFEVLNIKDEVPQSILSVLEAKLNSEPFRKDMDFGHAVSKPVARFHCQNVQNVIIGSNVIALNSAMRSAEALGYGTYLLSSSIVGDSEEKGQMSALLINYICRVMLLKKKPNPLLTSLELKLLKMGMEKSQLNDLFRKVLEFYQCNKPVCILTAGETTVNVTGSGVGGRSQHMVLSTALTLEKQLDNDVLEKFAIIFLSGGTDGQDGPTDYAGAVCDPHLTRHARKMGIDPEEFLLNNDSHNFFLKIEAGRNLIKTGLTGTNVMDLQIILISLIN